MSEIFNTDCLYCLCTFPTLSQHFPNGPLPDSEFSTGPCEVNGIGVPVLRARTRATKVEMEFCCASWLTCCAGVCIPYKGRKGAN